MKVGHKILTFDFKGPESHFNIWQNPISKIAINLFKKKKNTRAHKI